MNFAGQFDNPMLQMEATNLAFNTASAAAQQLALHSPSSSGGKAIGSPAAPPRTNRVGQVAEMFGGRLFERVIVIPPNLPLGVVLTAKTSLVDVWNTYRNVMQVMTGVLITGSGDGEVVPPSLPLPFAPLGFLAQSVVYPTSGDPIIAQSIDFVFAGQPAALLVVTGSRFAVFTIEPNWGAEQHHRVASDLADQHPEGPL